MRAAHHRHDAEIAEEVRRHLFDIRERLGLAVNEHGRTIHACETNNVRQRIVVCAHRVERLRRERVERLSELERESDLPDLDEAIWIAHGERAQQQVVDQAEKRRVGANTECQ
jgi:hypothetical protein